MKVLSPFRFKAWLVAVATIVAITMVLVAPLNRPRAQSPAYTIIDLGTLVGGAESKAFAINSNGQVAGYATVAGNSKRPFFRPSGSLINLGVLSGDGTATSVNNLGYVVGTSPTNARAFIWHDDNNDGDYSDAGETKDDLLPVGRQGSADDINDSGRVVGWVTADGENDLGYQAFVWENNNFQIINGTPAHNSPLAHGINNAGTIVGEDSDGPRAWILRGGVNGVFTDIGVFAASNEGRSVAYAVSEADHVVGTAQVSSGVTHAFIWTDAGMNPGLKDLGTLSGLTSSDAYSVAIVNSRLQVVGTSYNDADPASSGARAFVWQDDNGDGDADGEPGELRNLNDLIPAGTGWILQQARSINSAGQIVGYGTIGGQTHAFLLTPTNLTPTVTVGVSPASVNEDGATDLTYTFTRSPVTSSALTVNFTVGGGAGFSTDYTQSGAASFTASTGSVTIPANVLSKTVTVNPALDLTVEPDETVLLNIAANASYTIGTPSGATGTITNDDVPTVTVGVSPSATAEDGATNLVYTFTRNSTIGSLSVNFSVGGTATFSTDYTQSGAASFTPPTGTVAFGAGNASATVTVNPTTDSAVEPDETVILTLTANAAYTIGSPSGATGTITNDETIQLSQATFTVNEDSAVATITVTRGGDTSGSATVNYATSDLAGLQSCTLNNTMASERCDYTTAVGTVTFAAGETSKNFTVPIVNDVWVEGNETFFVNLSNPTGALLGSQKTSTVEIVDNDFATPTSNPIFGVEYFIRAMYRDILNRQPDGTGLQNWIDTLTPCPNGGFGEPPTSNCDRLHVAAGFFQSDEYLNRGYWAFRFYMVSFNQRPTYAQFIPDLSQVGGPKSPAEEEVAKVAYAEAFVQRPAFTSMYSGLHGQALANALVATTGLPPYTVQSGETDGEILRHIAERQTSLDKFLTEGTVSILYFGFQRRDPDAIGYQNNVDTLNANPNNLRHMIFIFIYSTEYLSRFGPP